MTVGELLSDIEDLLEKGQLTKDALVNGIGNGKLEADSIFVHGGTSGGEKVMIMTIAHEDDVNEIRLKEGLGPV